MTLKNLIAAIVDAVKRIKALEADVAELKQRAQPLDCIARMPATEAGRVIKCN